MTNTWENAELHLSHQEYKRLIEKLSDLTVIKPDGSLDRGQFVAWCMREFPTICRPFTNVQIVVDDF